MQEERWLLPAGIEEVLPPQARVIEGLRRDLLDLYQGWGYDLAVSYTHLSGIPVAMAASNQS